MTSTKQDRPNKTKQKGAIAPELVDFDTWFFLAWKTKTVRPEQKPEIRVFFDLRGLGKSESCRTFDDALKLY